jgi:hypothetical protein
MGSLRNGCAAAAARCMQSAECSAVAVAVAVAGVLGLIWSPRKRNKRTILIDNPIDYVCTMLGPLFDLPKEKHETYARTEQMTPLNNDNCCRESVNLRDRLACASSHLTTHVKSTHKVGFRWRAVKYSGFREVDFESRAYRVC